MKRVHAIVRGTVQGVGFRYTVAESARGHGVAGWVRNRTDGSVEAELEGRTDAVDAVLADLSRGPRTARVTGVDAHEIGVLGETGFEVRATE